MKHVLLCLGCAAALGACNKSPKIDAKNATPAEVAKQMRESGAELSMIRPGLWQSTITIEKFDMPGMPPEMVQRMKAMMAERQAHGFETCLTTEDVKKPKEDFFAGKDNQCRYDHFTMGGGKIDAAMKCGKGESSTAMNMIGTYSPDSYQVQTATRVEGSDQAQGAMQMQMRVEARRVGECSSKQG